MTEAPTTVWNEVRFTSDGISISLFSESQDGGGAILEDELWFTFDELQEMAPSEPLSLRLTDETRAALADSRESAVVENLAESEIESGDIVQDTNPPSWSEASRLRVVGVSEDVRADEYVIQGKHSGRAVPKEEQSWTDETVADANPSASPDERIVFAKYIDGDGESDEYAFPESRVHKIST